MAKQQLTIEENLTLVMNTDMKCISGGPLLAHTVAFLTILSCVQVALCGEATGELGTRISNVLNRPKDSLSSYRDSEAELVEFLPAHKSPSEKGQIYTGLAFLFAQTGFDPLRPEWKEKTSKTIVYCEQAFRYPLHAAAAAQVSVYWADAIEMRHNLLREEDFSTARRQITEVCLNGLKELSKQLRSTAKRDVPIIHLPNYIAFDQNDLEYKKAREKYEEEFRDQQRIGQENRLIDIRSILVGKCISLYTRQPQALDELKALVNATLGDTPILTEITQAISARAKD